MRIALPTALCLLCATHAFAQASGEARARLDVEPRWATVGEALAATLTVELPEEWTLRATPIGPELGPFSVDSGSWSEAGEGEAARSWVWSARLSAFRTGELEVPPIRIVVEGPGAERSLSTEPVAVTIHSVLSEEDLAAPDPELADLKGPASIPPSLGALWIALGTLALLLGAAALLWWLQRHYGSRLAAAPVPDDPFHRTPPHVWIYGELQKLLERRLPEQGEIDLFYADLSRILKRYLGGRFRVDLLEHTTGEVADLLRQGGAGAQAVDATLDLLSGCDQVKFARQRPGPPAWRDVVEQVYRIVDATKPAEGAVAERGAA